MPLLRTRIQYSTLQGEKFTTEKETEIQNKEIDVNILKNINKVISNLLELIFMIKIKNFNIPFIISENNLFVINNNFQINTTETGFINQINNIKYVNIKDINNIKYSELDSELRQLIR